jgi:hypothetical protein
MPELKSSLYQENSRAEISDPCSCRKLRSSTEKGLQVQEYDNCEQKALALIKIIFIAGNK